MANTNNPMTILKVVDPILSSVARGYSNNEFVGVELFPEVIVDTETGKIPLFGKDTFLTYPTERALRADSNSIDGGGVGTTDYAMIEHDLEQPLDLRELTEPGTIPLKLESYHTTKVQGHLDLDRELAYANLAQADSTYIADSIISKTTGTYLSETTVDPVVEIENLMQKVKNLIGKPANTLIMGDEVWRHLRKNPILISYFITVAGAKMRPTPEDLATLLGLNKIVLGASLYSEDKATFKRIWGNSIEAAYVAPPTDLGRSQYEPSFGYTLKKSGYPFVDTRMDPNGKVKLIRSTDLYTIKVVGKESGAKMNTPINPSLYGA